LAVEGLLPLESLNVAGTLSKINSETAKAAACANIGVPKLPGIPDIPTMIETWIMSNWEGLKTQIRDECETFLEKFEAESNQRVVDEVNKFIKKLNDFVKKLNKLLDAITKLIAPLCPIIIAISIIAIVAKVITMIPSFGGGFMAVVVATMPAQIASAIYTFASVLVNHLNKVPFALIAVMTVIVAIYQYIVTIYNMIVLSIKRQQDLLANATAAILRTADDWLNIDYDRKAEADARLAEELHKLNQWDELAGDVFGSGPGGLVGNMSIRLGLQLQINEIDKQVAEETSRQEGKTMGTGNDGDAIIPSPPSLPPTEVMRPEPCDPIPPSGAYYDQYPENFYDECGNRWVCEPSGDPLFPCDYQQDGSNILADAQPDLPEITSPYCDENGHCWEWGPPWILLPTVPADGPEDTKMELEDVKLTELKNLKTGLELELNNIGGPLTRDEMLTIPEADRGSVYDLFDKLGNTIITSLLYPHEDITVEKATQRKGKRYGFYQQDIKE
tara:strand:+ start:2680 stop:4185 length:1506 start_codon:yes stop_codon:yes gene_type:complete